MKMIAAISLAAILLSGCSYGLLRQPEPLNVALIPADCANRVAIDNWLETQLTQRKSIFETQNEYENSVRQIKERLWNLRARCAPGVRNDAGRSDGF